LHGENRWQSHVEKIDQYDYIVFMGDYMDSFTHLDVELIENLSQIINFKGTYPNKVILLLGNHDNQYAFLDYQETRCSGFRQHISVRAKMRYRNNFDLFTVAFQTQLLDVKKGNKVLEIGTGSGYQTAVLCEVGARVYSVERQSELFIKAKEDLKILGYAPGLFFGDGYKGLPVYAPFDGVLVTCGAPFLHEKLVEQVKVGGRIVIPIGDDGKQIMFRYTKNADGSLSEESFGDFAFVPMLEKVAK
jgi:protein-L-isoaspartate(D-aspartate) O-methyltransferase